MRECERRGGLGGVGVNEKIKGDGSVFDRENEREMENIERRCLLV